MRFDAASYSSASRPTSLRRASRWLNNSRASSRRLHKCALEIPGFLLRRCHTLAGRLVEHVHDLAVDIELQLRGSGVTDAHRRGAPIARQPRDFPFIEAALPGKAIH